jgi:hypothetical protein
MHARNVPAGDSQLLEVRAVMEIDVVLSPFVIGLGDLDAQGAIQWMAPHFTVMAVAYLFGEHQPDSPRGCANGGVQGEGTHKH